MKHTVIYDSTSGANAALDTGALNLIKFGGAAALFVEVIPSGAMTTGNVQLFDPDVSSTNELGHFATGTGTTPVLIGWGPSCGTAAVANTGYLGGLSMPLPPKVQFKVPALGAAVTARVRVILAE